MADKIVGQTCKSCGELASLPPQSRCCPVCTMKEIERIAKRIKYSTVAGIAIIVLIVQTNILIGFGFSGHQQAVAAVALFFAAFTGRVRIGEIWPRVLSAGQKTGAGTFISVVEILISPLSGPFFVVYLPYKLRKLREYV